jgi:hypothetical protein
VPAGAPTVIVPPSDLPGGEPDRLTSGLRAAVVNVTDDRTRIAPDAEAPDATEVVRPPGSRWRTIGVTLLVLAVLATGGTLAAVLGGYLKLPGAAAAGKPTPPVTTPPATPTTTPPASPSPSASLPGVVPAGTTATAGYEYRRLVHDDLSRPNSTTGWIADARDPANKGRCEVGPDDLEAYLTNHILWRCHGPLTVAPTDTRVVVDTRLKTADSCAGLWFRFNNERPDLPGGYVLQLCHDTWTLNAHNAAQIISIRTGTIPPSVDLGNWTQVQIEVIGDRITAWIGGNRLVSIQDGGYTDGHTSLGVLINTNVTGAVDPPFQVGFRNIDIYQITSAQ